MKKEEIRKKINWEEWEEIPRREFYYEYSRVGETVIHYDDGMIYLKPKEKYPKKFGNFKVLENGDIYETSLGEDVLIVCSDEDVADLNKALKEIARLKNG